MMNQFKMDWYLASQTVSEYLINRVIADTEATKSTHPFHDNDFNRVTGMVMETTARSVMTWALPTIFKHMSQNQIKGTIGIIGRTGGRIGIRAVPILGTALMVKDAYDLFEYLTD